MSGVKRLEYYREINTGVLLKSRCMVEGDKRKIATRKKKVDHAR